MAADYFENFDLEHVVTPIDVNSLASLLCESEYNVDEANFLIDGFSNGFSIGYEGDMKVRQTAPNLKFRGVGDKLTLWKKVMKEVKLKICRTFQ